MFLVEVNKNQVNVVQKEPITSGSVNAYLVSFSFSEEWEDLTRVAVFKADAEPVNVLLDDSNECFIPWEVMTNKEQPILFGVYGTMGSEVVLPTIWADAGTTLEGVFTGLEGQEPQPNLLTQLTGRIKELEDELENSSGGGGGNGDQELITIKDTTITNISQLPIDKFPCCLHMVNSIFCYTFNDDIIYVASFPGNIAIYTMDGQIALMTYGDDGVITLSETSGFVDGVSLGRYFYTKDEINSKLAEISTTPGPKGDDGFSPIVSTVGTEGGTEVTITDVNGPHTFEVLNGEPGPKGDSGNTPFIGPNGNWWIDGTDTGVSATGGSATAGNIPFGGIIIWFGLPTTIPDGWALCDGDNGTPDLRGRFVLGPSETHAIGSTGGSETVTLTVEQMPQHKHEFSVINTSTAGNLTPQGSNSTKPAVTGNTSTDYAGSSQPHDNMPPYYVLCYIMKL